MITGKLAPTQAIVGALPRFPAVFQALRRHKILSSLTALLLVAAIAAGMFVGVRSKANAAYVTAPVVRGDLTQTVTATGTVTPQNTVTVGTQVSGTIQALYVDYNSKVKKGQILARLDPSQLQAQLNQAQAALAQAQAQAGASAHTASGAQSGIIAAQASTAVQAANAQAAQAGIATADANVAKAKSALDVATQTVQRDSTLLSQGYISQSQYDADRSNAVAAQAALQSAQAAAVQARAQAAASISQTQATSAQASQTVAQAAGSADTAQAADAAVQAAQAQVQQDELNLQRSVITSPVDGTVIDRAVSVGQTVAASLQTPTLFTIAQDLQKMEVDIAVGEPDIGNVKPGDKVTFSVLAYPTDSFSGVVSKVRDNPTTVSNVVTYTVITLVDNPDNKLLPGMTANATIAVATASKSLLVPLQALAFRPSTSSPHAGTSHAGSAPGTAHASSGSPWGQTAAGGASAASAGSRGTLFLEQQGKAAPVHVRIDLVNGTQAAITPLSGTLNAGDNVIVASSAGQNGSRPQRSGASAMGSSMSGGIGRAIH